VLEFGKIVKKSVEREGMLGWQFNTVGVSDAITMGGDGMILLSPCACGMQTYKRKQA
jgi:dihydroxyacid dehydratase/phosphogluconate dehydratase